MTVWAADSHAAAVVLSNGFSADLAAPSGLWLDVGIEGLVTGLAYEIDVLVIG